MSEVHPKQSGGRLREAAARRVRSINIHSVTGNNPQIIEAEWETKAFTGYWLNESSGVRHNSNCPHYRDTK